MKESVLRLMRRLPVSALVGVALLLVFVLIHPIWLSPNNLLNIVKGAVPLLIVSAGMTMTILIGEMDLSVGGVMTASAAFAGLYLKSLAAVTGWEVFTAVLLACLTGMLFGMLNGMLIGRLRFPFWIVTFGTMSLSYGLTSGITYGNVISGYAREVRDLSDGRIFGSPVTAGILWAAVICAAVIFLTRRTRFGLQLYALGDSRNCALHSGIRVARLRFLTYTLSGLLAGIAGILLLARTNSTNATLGDGYEFNTIAAVIIGGTAIGGGRGGFAGTIFGAVFVKAMQNGFQMLGFSNFQQKFMLCIIIVSIIVFNTLYDRIRNQTGIRRFYSDETEV